MRKIGNEKSLKRLTKIQVNDMIKEKVTGYFNDRKKGKNEDERSCTCKSPGELDQRSERFYLL